MKGATYKSNTLAHIGQSRRSMIDFFGTDRPIDSVTEGDAEGFRAYLLKRGLAEATTRKHCSDARTWFRFAVRHRWIDRNPFESVPTAAIATSHLSYVSEEVAWRVAEEIADPDLRLLFMLARWGGLRIVSEPRELTWDCVAWERKRLRVPSPKTSRYGQEFRVIPIFPELAGPLADALDRAVPGDAYILPKLRRISPAALRKPMLAAIHRAGVPAWPRLWHNLRSSRQTDLEQRFPSHVVCAWLGNSRQVAVRHYLQILDSDFEKAAQNAAQYPHATGCTERKTDLGVNPQVIATPLLTNTF